MNEHQSRSRGPASGGEPAQRASGVVVLGMHRSGTSAVTRTLNLFGLKTSAAEDLIGPGPGNERGHWESGSLMECNQRLLGAVGASWYRPPAPGGGWIRQPAVQALKPLCSATFLRAHPAPGWVWKDPRTCLTLDLWLDLLERPAIVLVLRHPIHVARSLKQRNDIPLAYGAALWERYNREALRSVRGLPVLVLWFDDLMDETEACLDDVSAALTALGVGMPDAPRREMSGNLHGELRHHSKATQADAEHLTAEQVELLSVLCGLRGFYSVFPALDLPRESPGAVLPAA